MIDNHTKVQAGHRKRNAYLYIRQSTPRQVLEHQESTQRQYGLRQQALRLGWAEEQIVVIDTDLGQSGASAADRVGFQRLVTEVSLGRAGLVLGLEVSRLARNCSDWHRLLEICALTGTLILDEDGLYDPAHFNDRLLLTRDQDPAQSALRWRILSTDARPCASQSMGNAVQSGVCRQKSGRCSSRTPIPDI